MSATDWTLRCPHGHTNIRTNRLDPFNGATATAEYCCNTCRMNPDHYETCWYGKGEMQRAKPKGSNVDLGYVWSPSHDE